MTGLNSEIYRKAKKIIPGGTQLLSKRPELFSSSWPGYYSKAKGVTVWDLEQTEYVDMSIMGVGAAILGYADKFVDNKVIETIRNGVQTSLMSPLEVKLAELLLVMHPWFEKVRFAKSGGEAMSIAVRIARAGTGREKVFFSGYHGWHDWYLSANLGDQEALDGQLMPGLIPTGVPRSLKNTSFPVDLENISGSIAITGTSPSEIACIVIEPARGMAIGEKKLAELRDLCDKNGIILIFDEITSGFRLCNGCMHRQTKTKPHIAVIAKAMANGYACAAILGEFSVMDSAENSFISSTNWTESVGLAAALATIDKYETEDVAPHLSNMGKQMKSIWETAFKQFSVPCVVSGIDALPAFKFNGDDELSFYNFIVSELLSKGILGFRQFKPSYSHKQKHLDRYEEALHQVLDTYEERNRDLTDYTAVQTGFHRLTKE